ncbi:MAG: GNAT family N-acetyltransferase [Chlamydiota bacterium]
MSLQLCIPNSKNSTENLCLSQFELESKRLFIRYYKETDFENSTILYGNETITKYFDHGLPRSKDEVKNLIKKMCELAEKGEPFGLFSIFKKDDMSFIGHIDCLPTNTAGIIEIGYILHNHFQNQGFCSEAVRAFLFDYISTMNSRVDGIKIYRVIATVHPENSASKKIIENLGMRFEKSLNRFGQPRIKYFLNLT